MTVMIVAALIAVGLILIVVVKLFRSEGASGRTNNSLIGAPLWTDPDDFSVAHQSAAHRSSDHDSSGNSDGCGDGGDSGGED